MNLTKDGMSISKLVDLATITHYPDRVTEIKQLMVGELFTNFSSMLSPGEHVVVNLQWDSQKHGNAFLYTATLKAQIVPERTVDAPILRISEYQTKHKPKEVVGIIKRIKNAFHYLRFGSLMED